MAKIINITDKLDFSGKPKIIVKDTELTVNDDAETMLKIMGILGEYDEPGPKEVIEMYELAFDKENREKIKELALNAKSFTTLVFTAIHLISGEEEEGGEQ